MHIPTFKMSAFRQVCQHIQQGDCAFSVELKVCFFGNINLMSGRFCQFGFTALRVFTSFTVLILFLCFHKDFHVVISLDDILVLNHSKCTGNRA